jgi:hypothetical protein
MKTFKEHIIKTGNKYRLVSKKTGKNLGTYPSKAGAEKRERQVQYFKHMGESSSDHWNEAEEHLKKAKAAEAKSSKSDFHFHMADHHNALVQWHEGKGRHNIADKHAEKAEQHHEKAVEHLNSMKESSDYSKRRKGEEDIISGKKPARKKIPSVNDYFKRRAKEKANEEHTKCGTPECCGQCDTAINELSAETLKSYKEKAKKDVTSRPSDVLSHGKPRLSYFNTLKGIFTVNKKLKAKTPRG